MGYFDQMGFSPAQSAQLQFQLLQYAQQNPQNAIAVLSALNQAYAQDGLLRAGVPGYNYGQSNYGGPGAGSIPSPDIRFSGAPAGRGLTMANETGAQRTPAGTYFIGRRDGGATAVGVDPEASRFMEANGYKLDTARGYLQKPDGSYADLVGGRGRDRVPQDLMQLRVRDGRLVGDYREVDGVRGRADLGGPNPLGTNGAAAQWPQGSVKTAGGYTVVPEGNTNWSIYGPDQKHGEKPMTRVWGDPHVSERDGTHWDFTKSSDFALPDGTRLAVQTSAETGQSVSKSLVITNGADRVVMSGLDSGSPQTGAITQDGYEWRGRHVAANPGRDTFHLGGDGKDNVQWFKERNGQLEGLVTGATLRNGSYDQVVDRGRQYWVDPNLRPEVGSRAWGNQLRSETMDAWAQSGISPYQAQGLGQYMAADHYDAELQRAARHFYGGLPHHFNHFGQANEAVGNMGDVLLLHALQRQMLSANRFGSIQG